MEKQIHPAEKTSSHTSSSLGENMRLPALIVCAFLLQCTLGMDEDELPELTIVEQSETVTNEVVSTVENNSLRRRRSPTAFPIVKNTHSKHLKWVLFDGSLPEWAVKVDIPGTGEVYICAPLVGCDGANRLAGYYNPSEGPYCDHKCEYGDFQVNTEESFEILVNVQNLELLEWKPYEGQDQHDNAILATSNKNPDLLLGKNQHGIGYIFGWFLFVIKSGRAFDIQPFDVLVMEMGEYTQRVFDVQYQLDGLSVVAQDLTTLNRMEAKNNNCHKMEQEVSLEQSTERVSTWESAATDTIGHGIGASISSSLEASLLSVVTSTIEVGVSVQVDHSKSKTLTTGNSLTETINTKLVIKALVPPNKFCVVKMTGKSFKFDVPFTAQHTKTYTDGRVHTTTVSGTYRGVQVVGVTAESERCKPIPNAEPC